MRLQLAAFFHDHGPKDWPRGRVLYDTRTQKFSVYLNDQLQASAFEREILARFNLPPGQTLFASDLHYSQARFKLNAQGRQQDGGHRL
jgi:hypothetical protein